MNDAPIVNARMYAVTPGCKADWHALLGWACREAGLDWPILDYDPPKPLAALWARDDLGATMMCGLPFSRREPRPTIVAAPVPAPDRYAGRPVYFTDLAVRADAPAQAIEDTFGGVVGYTLADSFSGGVAPLAYLAARRGPAGPWRATRGDGRTGDHAAVRLYRGAVGGLIHARGVIEALADGRIDIGPLDSYVHDLLKAYDPGFAAQVRVIASTPARPIPPIVATVVDRGAELARLQAALLAAAEDSTMRPVLERLRLRGFAVPDAADYQALAAMSPDRTKPDGAPARHGTAAPFPPTFEEL